MLPSSRRGAYLLGEQNLALQCYIKRKSFQINMKNLNFDCSTFQVKSVGWFLEKLIHVCGIDLLLEPKSRRLLVIWLGSTTSVFVKRGFERESVNVKSTFCHSLASDLIRVGSKPEAQGSGREHSGKIHQLLIWGVNKNRSIYNRPASTRCLKHTTVHWVAYLLTRLRRPVPEQNWS